jgi:hypothetical protein
MGPPFRGENLLQLMSGNDFAGPARRSRGHDSCWCTFAAACPSGSGEVTQLIDLQSAHVLRLEGSLWGAQITKKGRRAGLDAA